jgi:hypothetical protein
MILKREHFCKNFREARASASTGSRVSTTLGIVRTSTPRLVYYIEPTRFRKRLKAISLRIAGIAALLLLFTYAGDYLSVRYRIPKGRDPFSNVTIQPYYAIHEKNGRTEYDFAQPETQMCIHSLFPHFGYSPCWYVNRHTDKRIDI